jgi:hypothetical protein
VRWTGEREFEEPTLARQMIEQTPPVSIGGLPENVVGRLRGLAKPFREVGVLIAPVTGRSCFLYLVHVEAIYLGHRQHFGERRGLSFVLEEDNHRAIIDPIYARVRLRYERVAVRVGHRGSTPSEQALLRRLRVPADPPIGNALPQFVFQEARLEPGTPAVVCGAGVREADPDAFDSTAMYRDGAAPATRLRIIGSQRAPIAVSNDPDLL